MQSVNNNGIFGEVQEYDTKNLQSMLKDKSVDRVEVFNGTPENIKKRKSMSGKKYVVKPAYQKAPKIK